VIIMSSSDDKLERARALGADVLVNYRKTPEWDTAVLDATAGLGADLIVETVGGASLSRSVNAAAIGGTIFVIGFIAGMEATVPVLPVMTKTLRIVGNQTGSTANLADAVRAIERSKIEPVVDRAFPFERAADAYAFLESGGHFGKVVIEGA
jgi:NADPH:quinone reductase-like Zn-dependent oxidoreductase